MNRIATFYYALLSVFGLLFFSSAVYALDPMEYKPFDGYEGYQEILVKPYVYYVAYHGKEIYSAADVDDAWATRVAQLCLANGANKYINLQYLFEPVLNSDPPVVSVNQEVLSGRYVKVAGGGFIFIPMNTPRSGNVSIEAPSKLGHVLCVTDASKVLNPARIVNVGKVMEVAKSRGWLNIQNKP